MLLVIVVVAIVLSRSHNSAANTTPNSMANTSNQSTAPSNNSVATNTVTIQNFAFSPSNITVKKGTTVTWTNKDSTNHTVTETDSQPGPNSGGLAPGKSYSFTFTSVGTFQYHCSIHPEMIAAITVTQ